MIKEIWRALFSSGSMRDLDCFKCGMRLSHVPHPYPEKCFACGESYLGKESE